MIQASSLVVGNGLSSLIAVKSLLAKEHHAPVVWIKGTDSSVFPVLPTSPSQELAQDLAAWFGDEPFSGTFLREFRNKSFRPPVWNQIQEPTERKQAMEQSLWEPEFKFVPANEFKLSLSLGEIEMHLRKELESLGESDGLIKFGEIRLKEYSDSPEAGILASFDSCEDIKAERAFIEHPHLRAKKKRGSSHKTFGLLQCLWTHTKSEIPADLTGGFFANIHRDSKDEPARSVFGYFMDGGKKSVWSLCLSEAELEDNHEIIKKLRRLKQTVDRMFADTLPGMINHLEGEQVRLVSSLDHTLFESLAEVRAFLYEGSAGIEASPFTRAIINADQTQIPSVIA